MPGFITSLDRQLAGGSDREEREREKERDEHPSLRLGPGPETRRDGDDDAGTSRNAGLFPHKMHTKPTALGVLRMCWRPAVALEAVWRICHPGPVLYFRMWLL